MTDDPYALLGVHPRSSESQIRRAFRLGVVGVHRRGVWRIGDHLQRLTEAHALLTDPEKRRAFDEARGRADAWGLPRSEEADRRRREGRVLRATALRLGREAAQRSARACAVYAPHLERLEAEHDARVLADAHRQRHAALWRRAGYAALLLFLACVMLLLVSR